MNLGTRIEDYVIGRLLGKGGFANVYEARCKISGQIVAIKMIDKKLIKNGEMEKKVRMEISIQRKLKHPALVELFTCFEDSNYVYLVLELCTYGDIQSFMKRRGSVFTEPEAKTVICQVVHGLKFLHRHNIIHRDLKPANILVSEDMQVKIGDFGLSKQLTMENSSHVTMCGTPNYIAPEVATRSFNGPQSDVWSVGVILYTLLVGQEPFNTSTIKSTLTKVVMSEHELPKHLSVKAQDLINKLLVKNPRDRISLDDILKHAFMDNHDGSSSCCELRDSGIVSTDNDITLPKNMSVTDKRLLSAIKDYPSMSPVRCERNCTVPSMRRHVGLQSEKENCSCLSNNATCRCQSRPLPCTNSLNLQYNHHSTSCSSRMFTNEPDNKVCTSCCTRSIVDIDSNNRFIVVKGIEVPPLNTKRLLPKRKRVDLINTIFTILESGEVISEHTSVQRKDKIFLCLRISRDGLRIAVYNVKLPVREKPPDLLSNGSDHIYSYHDLPKIHWERFVPTFLTMLPKPEIYWYMFAARFVETQKSTTMKLKYFSNEAECILMENSPEPDFMANFYAGGKVVFTKKMVKISDNGNYIQFDSSSSRDLPTWAQSLWSHSLQCRNHCLAVEEALERVNTDGTCFPCKIGTTPLSVLKTSASSPYQTVSQVSSTVDTSADTRLDEVQTRAQSTPLLPSRRKTSYFVNELSPGEVIIEFKDNSKLYYNSCKDEYTETTDNGVVFCYRRGEKLPDRLNPKVKLIRQFFQDKSSKKLNSFRNMR